MAPANSSAKARKAANSKQQARPVVPAIPLPYVKRQAAAAAAVAATPVPESPAPSAKQETNAPVEDHDGEDAAADTPQDVAVAESPASQTDGQTDIVTEPTRDPTTPTTNEPNIDTPAASSASAQEPAAENPTQQPLDQTSGPPTSSGPGETRPKHKPIEQPSDAPKPRHPTISPTRYHMPPPFQPASRPLSMLPNGDPRGPRPLNGPHHIHSAHPSNGSVHFGAFHDSASSSPAPHPGGIAPPPGMGMDGRQFMGPANGYPPLMPFGEMMTGGFDAYGRPVGFGPMDSYPPYGNFGPSTPHSFHGSQSSAHPEDGTYNQFPAPRNGGPGEESAQHQGRMFVPNPRMMPNGVPPHMPPQNDDADGLIGYLQQQFGSHELSDCTLELRYLDDRAPPVRIPGHRIVLARSPQIASLLQQQGLQPSPTDQALQIILLETDSRWIRSDAFYMATQRFYGAPLLPNPPRRDGDVTAAGSSLDQFRFALSYAAAGHLLQWSPLVRRGCEVATQILDWQTMEKALEFALEDFSDSGAYESYKYGEGSKILLHAVVTFIVHNLPSSFSIDSSTAEPEIYARLPGTPAAPSQPPPTTRGSVQFGKQRRSRKLSTIQFGDLSLTEGVDASQTPKASRPAHPVSHAVLSRVLLNLPFGQLKMILESAASGNVNGWANTESRYRVIKDAVQEREKRRLSALDAVVAGRVPDAESIRAQLRTPEPRSSSKWSTLGWQEQILPYGSNPDGPSLARKWVPLLDTNGSGAAYP